MRFFHGPYQKSLLSGSWCTPSRLAAKKEASNAKVEETKEACCTLRDRIDRIQQIDLKVKPPLFAARYLALLQYLVAHIDEFDSSIGDPLTLASRQQRALEHWHNLGFTYRMEILLQRSE